MEIPILLWLFQGIPECLAVAALALVLAGWPLEPQNVFLIGLPQAVAAYLVRLLPLSFGVHSIILIVILAVNLNVLLKIKLSRGILSALVVMIILCFAETIIISLMVFITGIPFEQVYRETYITILYGWPHVIFIFLLALGINSRRTRAFSIS